MNPTASQIERLSQSTVVIREDPPERFKGKLPYKFYDLLFRKVIAETSEAKRVDAKRHGFLKIEVADDREHNRIYNAIWKRANDSGWILTTSYDRANSAFYLRLERP